MHRRVEYDPADGSAHCVGETEAELAQARKANRCNDTWERDKRTDDPVRDADGRWALKDEWEYAHVAMEAIVEALAHDDGTGAGGDEHSSSHVYHFCKVHRK